MTETAVHPHEAVNALSEGSTPVPPYSRVMFVSCRSGVLVTERVLNTYMKNLPLGEEVDIPRLDGIDFKFSNTETCIQLERDVNGSDVFLYQSLYDPTTGCGVDENLIQSKGTRETYLGISHNLCQQVALNLR